MIAKSLNPLFQQKTIILYFNLILFLSIPISLFSQLNDKKEHWVTGEILTQTTSLPVPFSYVVNSRTGVGKETNESGQFKMHIQPGDSILFRCIGYMDTVWVASSIDLTSDTLRLITQHKTYALNEVDIIWFRSYASFKYRVANLKIETAPEIKLNLNLNTSDLTALASSQAKAGAGVNFMAIPGLIAQQFKKYKPIEPAEEIRYARFNKLTSRENLIALTGEKGPKLDSFIVFLRSKHKITPTLPDYEILAAIQLVYEDFLAINTDSIP
ncbi:MAG: hypothetical protein JEZ14_06390 [Marinilabiliaceae bacterium]|nr:hypothetical protein [Marinilabiliaceae bacterium]